MPVYVFRASDGERIEKVLPLSKFRRSIRQNGKTFYIDIAGQQAATPKSNCWPKIEEASGMHPDQVGEARDIIRQHGLKGVSVVDKGYDHPQTGCMKFESRKARAAWHKLQGFRDKSGGYSDYTGR